MKYENIQLEDGIKKEWLITNGIGGYASSTIVRSKYKKISWFINSATFTTGKKKLNTFKSR